VSRPRRQRKDRILPSREWAIFQSRVLDIGVNGELDQSDDLRSYKGQSDDAIAALTTIVERKVVEGIVGVSGGDAGPANTSVARGTPILIIARSPFDRDRVLTLSSRFVAGAGLPAGRGLVAHLRRAFAGTFDTLVVNGAEVTVVTWGERLPTTRDVGGDLRLVRGIAAIESDLGFVGILLVRVRVDLRLRQRRLEASDQGD
jgi:hypothetical protein